QAGPKPHSCASAATPATMTVVPSAAAKHQQQDDEQNQHVYLSNTFSTCPILFWTLPASSVLLGLIVEARTSRCSRRCVRRPRWRRSRLFVDSWCSWVTVRASRA